MEKVKINIKNSYCVYIGDKALDLALNLIGKRNTYLISDKNLYNIYKEHDIFKNHIGMNIVAPGEKSKSIKTWGKIQAHLAKLNCDRNTLIIAFGGGIIGDLAGFVAATYNRGIDFIQIPTTLLAAVDSSVGGKTALNLKEGKNLIGAFHHPIGVFTDTRFLKSLDQRQYSEGLAEMIKMAILFDRQYFEKFEIEIKNQDELIKKSVELKRDIVNKDEKENGLRKLLNFGHSVAHSIETCSEYRISHGEAVAIGMAMTARACEKKGLLKKSIRKKIESTLIKNKLPIKTDIEMEKLYKIGKRDKKVNKDGINEIIIRDISEPEIVFMDFKQWKEFLINGY